MERFYTFVFVAGLGCFAIAFTLSMVFPWMSLGSYHGMDYKTLEDLADLAGDELIEILGTEVVDEETANAIVMEARRRAGWLGDEDEGAEATGAADA